MMTADPLDNLSQRPRAGFALVIRIVSGDALCPQPFLDGGFPRLERSKSLEDDFALRSIGTGGDPLLYRFCHLSRQGDFEGNRIRHWCTLMTRSLWLG